MDEAPLLYHVVLTLHNSRTSQRMRQFRVVKKDIKFLTIQDEIEFSKIFKSVINELNLKCFAYNICRDHVHLVIQSKEDEVVEMIRKIKGKTAYLFNRSNDRSGPFWSQKFYIANLDDWSFGTVTPKAFKLNDTYFQNAIAYIKSNRIKHELPESDALNQIIKSFVMVTE